MKTDHPIYQYLATGPDAFRVLTNGITLTNDYQFSSTTLKNIERRIDALFVPRNNNRPVYISEQEILDMLHILTPLEETRAYQSILAKGISKGKIEGKMEGKIEGESAVLKRQLIRRFGVLPKWAEQRIDTANITQLELWAEAIFDAENIETLLNST